LVGAGVALGVGFGVGDGVLVGVAEGVGDGVAVGVADGAGDVALGVGVGAADGEAEADDADGEGLGAGAVLAGTISATVEAVTTEPGCMVACAPALLADKAADDATPAPHEHAIAAPAPAVMTARTARTRQFALRDCPLLGPCRSGAG